MDARTIAAQREQIVNTYQTYLLALTAAFHEAAGQMPLSARQDFLVKLGSVARVNRGYIRQAIEVASFEIIKEAIKDAAQDTGVGTLSVFESLIDDDIGALNMDNIRATVDDITNQMSRDEQTLLAQYNNLSYMAKISYAQGGKIDRIKQDALAIFETMPFSFLDRAGRRWRSERFVRTRLNMHLFHLYNETYLYGLSLMRQDTAKINYLKRDHANQGLVFSISGASSELPSYAEVKEKLFHPNTEAVVSQA